MMKTSVRCGTVSRARRACVNVGTGASASGRSGSIVQHHFSQNARSQCNGKKRRHQRAGASGTGSRGSAMNVVCQSKQDLLAAAAADPMMSLLSSRVVFLASQVDDVSADAVISQLLLLDSQDSEKDIRLYINSPGGSVTAGLGIYDAMQLCRADVSTVCFGLAASMGAFLLCAGAAGKRYAMPNARIMIHQPLGGGQVKNNNNFVFLM